MPGHELVAAIREYPNARCVDDGAEPRPGHMSSAKDGGNSGRPGLDVNTFDDEDGLFGLFSSDS